MTGHPQSLEDRLSVEHAEAWKPAPGETVIGELIAVAWNDAGWGEYPICTLRRDDGSAVAVHAFRQVLQRELAEQRPRLGERIGIRHLGRADSGYYRYRLAVDRAEPAAVDWTRAAGAETTDPAGSSSPRPPQDEPEDIPF